MLLRRVARPLLAAIFVSGGVDQLLNPEPKARAATPLLAKGQDALPTEHSAEPSTLVQVDAAVKVGAGLLLAVGRAPRLAAAALAASLVPTTVVGHAFWEASDDDRSAQKIHFLKNAGLLGGLMLAAADTHDKRSLARQAKQARKQAKREVGRRTEELSRRARKAQRKAEHTSKRARKSARSILGDAVPSRR